MSSPPIKHIFINSLRQAVKYFSAPKSAKSPNVTCVGQDHLGNKYFESDTPARGRPVKRYFEREDLKDVDSFHDIAKVPPVWDSWLRFKRAEPPTDEELKESEDYFKMQQERVKKSK